jgi:hypothetical protein
VEVRNTREIPVKVEITRNLQTKSWDLEKTGEGVAYEKVDADTVKFTMGLQGRATRGFRYVLTTRHGTRAE